MIRFFLVILLLLFLYAILRHLIHGIFKEVKKLDHQSEPEEFVEDPCCQTYIQKRTAMRKRVGGRDYYFCGEECLRKFLGQKAT